MISGPAHHSVRPSAAALGAYHSRSYQWLISTDDTKRQAVRTSEWTPVQFAARQHDDFDVNRGLDAVSTTVTAASNLAVLPQGTINVADTTGFPTPGAGPGALKVEFAYIQPAGANPGQVIRYTGKTGTTLTGCTLGSITLATGDVVTVARTNIFGEIPQRDWGYLINSVAVVKWAPNATGYRRIRMRAFDAVFNFPVLYGNDAPGINVAGDGQYCQLVGQPAVIVGTNSQHVIEVWQNSGADLGLMRSLLDAPITMQASMSAPAPGSALAET